MQPARQDAADKRTARAAGNGSRVAEADRLRATCGRQRVALEKLRDAVTILRCGAAALKEQNAELRAELACVRGEEAADRGEARPRGGSRRAEAQLPADTKAQSAARRLVERCLGPHIAPEVLAGAKLVTSELVGNSVRHGATGPEDVLVVRVVVERTTCRIEVEDSGCLGEVAPRRPDHQAGGGLGLHIVQELSERWGLERTAGGGTRVWAHLALTQSTGPGEDAPETIRVLAGP